MRIDLVRQEIANLAFRFPQLADDPESWAISIESETGAFDVLRQIERRRQEAAAFAGGIAGTIAELEARQARFVEREKAMRALAFRVMEIAEIKKAEFAEATYSIRNGQQKLIGDVDPRHGVPAEYVRTTVEIDRAKIKEALKAGTVVTGFELSNAEPTLSIRTK
jgi:hypothetical protein